MPPSKSVPAGTQFGRLTVIRDRTPGELKVPCRCECGAEKIVWVSALVKGDSQSCGCLQRERTRDCNLARSQHGGPPLRELCGSRFGRLTVVRDRTFGSDKLLCRCECGTEKLIRYASLINGATQSCGCLQRDRVAQSNTFRRTHGMSNTRAYTTWAGMLDRCRRPGYKDFHLYGGRGITVCDRWQSFENFYADMGDPPVGMSLDRLDPNMGYSPENCRWATAHEQVQNRRPSTEWRRRASTHRGSRHIRTHLTEDDVRRIRHLYALGGVTQAELGAAHGISTVTVSQIIRRRTWTHVEDRPEEHPAQQPLGRDVEKEDVRGE